MKKKRLLFGLLSGLVCALCVLGYTNTVYKDADSQRQETISRYGGEQVEVLVATKDIYPGETITYSNVTTKTWVSNLLPEGAIVDSQEAIGKETSSLILSGEVVSEMRFKSVSADIQIPDGLVAVSVPAKEVQAVGGAIKSGSLVDVYATGIDTTCLGNNILVLATNASSNESSSKTAITWVTLAVDPSRVQEYVTASQSMDLYFTLPSVVKKETEDSSSSNGSNELNQNNEQGSSEIQNSGVSVSNYSMRVK